MKINMNINRNEMNHGMRIAHNKQLNGMNMNIKCIQRRGQKSLTFTIKPSKTLESKKGKKKLQSVTEYMVDLEI